MLYGSVWGRACPTWRSLIFVAERSASRPWALRRLLMFELSSIPCQLRVENEAAGFIFQASHRQSINMPEPGSRPSIHGPGFTILFRHCQGGCYPHAINEMHFCKQPSSGRWICQVLVEVIFGGVGPTRESNGARSWICCEFKEFN